MSWFPLPAIAHRKVDLLKNSTTKIPIFMPDEGQQNNCYNILCKMYCFSCYSSSSNDDIDSNSKFIGFLVATPPNLLSCQSCHWMMLASGVTHSVFTENWPGYAR